MEEFCGAEPLVSCIMPTFNRRKFIEKAISCFVDQTYSNKELIILDDGTDKVQDLIPINSQIKYLQSHKLLLGEKRNLAIEISQGKFIAVWDDDDWHSPNRLSFQVNNLLNSNRDLCGLKSVYYHHLETGKVFLFSSKTKHLMIDGTLLFKKSIYSPFNNQQVAATVAFIKTIPLDRQLLLDAPHLYLATIHKGNTSQKSLRPPYWTQTNLKVEDICV